MLTDAVEQLAERFPELKFEFSFDALIPLIHIELNTRVLEPTEMSVLAKYMLQAVELGINNLEDVAGFFGLQLRDFAPAGAELLMSGLIARDVSVPGAGDKVVITLQGRQYLSKERKHLVPRQKRFHLHFDGLLHQVTPLLHETISNSSARKLGTFVLPTRFQEINLADLTVSSVQEAVNPTFAGRTRLEIVSLRNIGRTYSEYLKCRIYVLSERGTAGVRYAVFHGSIYDQERSAALQRLAEIEDVVPSDFEFERFDTHSTILPTSLATSAQLVRESAAILAKAVEAVDATKARLWTTLDERERASQSSRVQELERAVEILQRQHEEKINLLEGRGATYVSTFEHRELLESTIDRVKRELIIVSPWMNTDSVNPQLQSLIIKALYRGVTIRIGYGYPERNAAEQDRKDLRAKNAIRTFDSIRSSVRGQLRFTKLNSTHEKVLLCDREFYVQGSFNWLSYRGDKDEDSRTEGSVIIRDPQFVEDQFQRLESV